MCTQHELFWSARNTRYNIYQEQIHLMFSLTNIKLRALIISMLPSIPPYFRKHINQNKTSLCRFYGFHSFPSWEEKVEKKVQTWVVFHPPTHPPLQFSGSVTKWCKSGNEILMFTSLNIVFYFKTQCNFINVVHFNIWTIYIVPLPLIAERPWCEICCRVDFFAQRNKLHSITLIFFFSRTLKLFTNI